MDPDSKNAEILAVGLNTSKKLIKTGGQIRVLLADDCSPYIKEEILSLAAERGVQTDTSFTMEELGAKCVGCAVCVIRA